MGKLVSFFEIPAEDFQRAVRFYSLVFDIDITVFDCGETEKMGFFPGEEGAISMADGFRPSADGVLISLATDDLDSTLSRILSNQGKVVIPKTAIQAEGKGHFAVFLDSEGNKVGLHQK